MNEFREFDANVKSSEGLLDNWLLENSWIRWIFSNHYRKRKFWYLDVTKKFLIVSPWDYRNGALNSRSRGKSPGGHLSMVDDICRLIVQIFQVFVVLFSQLQTTAQFIVQLPHLVCILAMAGYSRWVWICSRVQLQSFRFVRLPCIYSVLIKSMWDPTNLDLERRILIGLRNDLPM